MVQCMVQCPVCSMGQCPECSMFGPRLALCMGQCPARYPDAPREDIIPQCWACRTARPWGRARADPSPDPRVNRPDPSPEDDRDHQSKDRRRCREGAEQTGPAPPTRAAPGGGGLRRQHSMLQTNRCGLARRWFGQEVASGTRGLPPRGLHRCRSGVVTRRVWSIQERIPRRAPRHDAYTTTTRTRCTSVYTRTHTGCRPPVLAYTMTTRRRHVDAHTTTRAGQTSLGHQSFHQRRSLRGPSEVTSHWSLRGISPASQ